MPGRKAQPLSERLVAADLGYSTPCLRFTGSLSSRGYGVVTIEGRNAYVHRLVWQRASGPIPEGMTVDHLCHPDDGSCPGGPACPHRACGEITHLTLISNRDNVLRGVGPSAQSARKTHCIHGHPLSGENLYVRPNGVRECRTCVRARQKAAS